MEQVDAYIPEPTRDTAKPFLMPIEDVFTITGRGTVVTGRIEQGQINSGDTVEIVGIHPEVASTVVTGLEMFNKTLDFAQAGDNAGVLLRGTKREEVERGQVLAKPKSITPHTHFKAEVYVLSKEEGGRHTPFFNGYRPVLLPDDGRDRLDQAPGGPGDGHAGRQHEHGDRAGPADRDGPGSPFRNPRGRPHRGCGRRHRDHQLGETLRVLGSTTATR